jgi:hypothetical protein
VKGLSVLFAINYGVGLLSALLCLVLAVTVLVPDEWNG